ncbi:hypothetical protein ACODT5_28750 [Streptomyces sp. 5.8]|uniref:hypothetical protein n=1 Tax=Streptomyces sp. 5.8 TaxID=3406571 RepID=UPI003BB61169
MKNTARKNLARIANDTHALTRAALRAPKAPAPAKRRLWDCGDRVEVAGRKGRVRSVDFDWVRVSFDDNAISTVKVAKDDLAPAA